MEWPDDGDGYSRTNRGLAQASRGGKLGRRPLGAEDSQHSRQLPNMSQWPPLSAGSRRDGPPRWGKLGGRWTVDR